MIEERDLIHILVTKCEKYRDYFGTNRQGVPREV